LRFVKAQKLYFSDTGLLSYVLGLSGEKMLKDSSISGKIFENFIVTELRKQATWSKERVSIYHFREHSGGEVDIVLENSKSKIIAIEAKNTETVRPDDFNGLKLLQEKVKTKFVTGIIIYNGSSIIPAGDNLFAVPVSALWI
jgi:predicted AAA+ superfamily ATPase